MQEAKLLVDDYLTENQTNVSDAIIPLMFDVSSTPKMDVMVYVGDSKWGKTWLLTHVIAACAISAKDSTTIGLCSMNACFAVACCNTVYRLIKQMGGGVHTIKKTKYCIILEKNSDSVVSIPTVDDENVEYHDPFVKTTVRIDFLFNENIIYPEHFKSMDRKFNVFLIDDVFLYGIDILSNITFFLPARKGTRFILMGRMKYGMKSVERKNIFDGINTVVEMLEGVYTT